MSNSQESETKRTAPEKAIEGQRLLNTGDYEGATAAFTEATKLDPSVHGSYQSQAEAYSHMEMEKEAAKLLLLRLRHLYDHEVASSARTWHLGEDIACHYVLLEYPFKKRGPWSAFFGGTWELAKIDVDEAFARLDRGQEVLLSRWRWALRPFSEENTNSRLGEEEPVRGFQELLQWGTRHREFLTKAFFTSRWTISALRGRRRWSLADSSINEWPEATAIFGD